MSAALEYAIDAPRRGRPSGWDDERKARLRKLWADPGLKVDEIALDLGTSRGGVYIKARELDLPPRPGGRKRRPRSAREPGSMPVQRTAMGQRRFEGIEPTGESRIILAPFHPASREGSTIFPSTVIAAGKLSRLLKSGMNSRKIGGRVTKGRYQGFPIFMLTLEERETCPRSCEQWGSCYGNNMHMAQRISDDGTLIRRLWAELAAINAEHPRGFLVRLHVLGDFYSLEYARLWRQALSDFPGLVVFGFTRRRPPDPIGQEIAEIMRDFYQRFRMRFSGLAMAEDGAIVIDRREDAIGILCPAEADPERCCASCGLCWHSNKTISFLRH